MPLLTNSTYRPPLWARNAHVNTVLSAIGRQVTDITYEREHLTTPDDDFLDLDWFRSGNKRLLVVLHGLEGSTDRPYMRGMVRCAGDNNWDALALNFRGCSGEDNRQVRTYHMGETSDLNYVVWYALEKRNYASVALAGFSLGGNVVLMYLGRDRSDVPDAVVGGVAFSVPCHIPSANDCINNWENAVYRYRFMRTLNQKLRQKAMRFPEVLPNPAVKSTDFFSFDDYFTAPVHGFSDAQDYWESCSSLLYLPDIQKPTLLINAWDDTFLSRECYPEKLAAKHPSFYLEVPRWGGHVGFYTPGERYFWSEKRALEFLNSIS